MIDQGKHTTNSHGKVKTKLLRVRLCDSGDVYIFVKGVVKTIV